MKLETSEAKCRNTNKASDFPLHSSLNSELSSQTYETDSAPLLRNPRVISKESKNCLEKTAVLAKRSEAHSKTCVFLQEHSENSKTNSKLFAAKTMNSKSESQTTKPPSKD